MNWYTCNNLKDLLTAKINETGGVVVVNHQGTYTKVPYYINPTKRDLGQISSNDLVRAFIMPNKNIVAWNPYEATHSEMVENNEELKRGIPVYLWPFGEVMITDFSKSNNMYGNPELAGKILSNENLQKLYPEGIEEIGYFDESIRGKWHEKDLLTAQNWYDFIDDPDEQMFQKLIERYKKVNAFLKRTEINEAVKKTLEELKRRIVDEIRQVQMRMRR